MPDELPTPDAATDAPPPGAQLMDVNADVPVQTPRGTMNIPAWAQALEQGAEPPPSATGTPTLPHVVAPPATLPTTTNAAPDTALPPPPADLNEAPTPDVKVALPDGRIVNLGPNPTPELREQVKAKIRADFPELAPGATSTTTTTTSDTPGATEPPKVMGFADVRKADSATVGKALNATLGLDEDHPLGRYGGDVVKAMADGASDFHDALTNPNPDGMDASGLAESMKLMHPAIAPIEAMSGLAEHVATDAGLPPAAAKVLGLVTALYAGAKLPVGGAGAAAEAEPAAVVATKSPGIEPSVANAERAVEALNPAGTTVTEGAQAAKTGVQKALTDVKDPTQGIYNAVAANNANAVLAPPEKYTQLKGMIDALRTELGSTLAGQPAKVVDALEAKVKSGTVTYADLEPFKTQLDTLFRGRVPVGSTPRVTQLYDFKWQLRDTMRSMVGGEDKSWLEAADTLWKAMYGGEPNVGDLARIPKAKFVDMVTKADPQELVERLFGNGGTDKQAAMARRVMSMLQDDAVASSKLKEAFFQRLLKPAADTSVDPVALLKRYDALNPAFRSTMNTPGAQTFFDVLRREQSAGASAAAKLAQWTKAGLRFAAGTAIGGAAGHPLIGAGIELGGEALAKALADSKIATLLARAIKTPADSAVAPTLLQQLKTAGILKES